MRLRHSRGYESYYLHLSAFGPGIRAGARVEQGQLIGRVGATGLATGPHLDYRLRRNGVFVNPLTEHRNMPPGDPVPDAARAAFEEARDRVLAMLGAAMQEPSEPVPDQARRLRHGRHDPGPVAIGDGEGGEMSTPDAEERLGVGRPGPEDARVGRDGAERGRVGAAVEALGSN